MTDVKPCEFDAGCGQAASYLVIYDYGYPEDPAPAWAICAEHTAELRANDPLDYIATVRSLPLIEREASRR